MATDPRFTPSGAGGSGGERSLSSWLGCGCAGIVTVVMVVVVLFTFLTYRAGQRLEEMVKDAEQAAAAVQEVVPYGELPAGYHPIGAVHVPFLMDVAFLGGPGSPVRQDDGATFEQGFLYVRIRDWFGRGERSRGWLESGEGDQSPIEQEEIRFDPEEVVDRGELTVGEAEVAWVTRRGEIQIDRSRFGDEESERGGSVVRVKGEDEAARTQDGLLNLMSIRCGDDGWERMGIWFVPDPDPRAPVEEVDWDGTPADPEAVTDFLRHFQLCTAA